MIQRPARLQGTDGVRGRISSAAPKGTSNPIEYFLTSGLLTPEFFECYTYAFGCLLKESGLAMAGDVIVIGWDPRDRDGCFNQAAISGIQKAGLNAVVAGVLPTPAIPLYMLSIKAAGAVVLTASHNPADQNGIKLFCGHTALKLLPPDDIALTDLLYRQCDLKHTELLSSGQVIHQETAAKEFFIRFCLDPRNSWIEHDVFDDTILVVDASKGAVATIAKEIFSQQSWHRVVFTNLEGAINEHCGVADIEGQETISRKNVMEPGAKFEAYQTLRTLFELADSEVADRFPQLKLAGLVFDGDGDRCFRIDYLPEQDCLAVSSGDLLAIHQARMLARQGNLDGLLFVNTVESDLKTAITARELGFTPVLTGVGDKWLLARAVVDLIQSYLPAESIYQQQFDAIVTQKTGMSALQVTRFWKNLQSEQSFPPIRQPVFSIGVEESGHCITPGFMEIEGKTVACFSGNGIKTALNSFKAVAVTVAKNDWYKSIAEPFPAGIRKTYYTYYVEKARLSPGSEFRAHIQKVLLERFHDFFPAAYHPVWVEFPEEQEMLYCSIQYQGKQAAAIFVRNSGTEDKSALYLRGEKHLANYLKAIGEELHLLMLVGLKDRANMFAAFEIELLQSIHQKKEIDSLLKNASQVPSARIINEIERKENLVTKEQGKLVLTPLGKRFIDSWQ